MTREQCLSLIKGDERMEMVYTQSMDLCRTVYKKSGNDVIETHYGAEGNIVKVVVIKDAIS